MGFAARLLIEKQQPLLEATITRWFASKESCLHAAAADIVSRFVQEARQDSERAIRLDNSELNALDEHDVQRIICALVGYLDDFRALASLLMSVFSRKDVSKRLRKLIVDALANVVLYNMPDPVGEYLRDVTRDTTIPEHVRQVVKEALTHSDTYYASLKSRPELKELASPDIRVRRFLAAYYKQLSHSYQKNVFNESGLLSMIPKTPVKYGRASFSDERGNATSAVPMRTFISNIVVPRELIIDPMGHTSKRMVWQGMAVEGLPVESVSGSERDSHGSNKEKEE